MAAKREDEPDAKTNEAGEEDGGDFKALYGRSVPLSNEDIGPRFRDFGKTAALLEAFRGIPAELKTKMSGLFPGLGEDFEMVGVGLQVAGRPINGPVEGIGLQVAEGSPNGPREAPPAGAASPVNSGEECRWKNPRFIATVEFDDTGSFLMCATAYRFWWVQEKLKLRVTAGFGEIPLELHRMAHLVKAYPKNKAIAAMAASGEWAYVLLVNYPKLGPVCGLGYRRGTAPADFEGRKVAPGAEWESLLALVARGLFTAATDADTLRILHRLIPKFLRGLIREPAGPKRSPYPGSLKDLQRTLTHGPGTPADIDRSPTGQQIARLTYSKKIQTQLVFDTSGSSREDVNAFLQRTARELGALTLKVWHAAVWFAAQDMMRGLGGDAFWWSPDRLLALEEVQARPDSRAARQEKLRLLRDDLCHEVQLAGPGGATNRISGPLIRSIEADTTCTISIPGRRVKEWQLVSLHPVVGEEIRQALRKGRFALLDTRWFRLDAAKHPIALCLYPFLEDQWRRNAYAIWAGKREKWLGLSVRTIAEAAGLDIDVDHPATTRKRIAANLAKLEALGLIGRSAYSEGETIWEDVIDVRPPEDHEGIAALFERYEKTRPKALPAASSDTVC